jgi:hypothetical protein
MALHEGISPLLLTFAICSIPIVGVLGIASLFLPPLAGDLLFVVALLGIGCVGKLQLETSRKKREEAYGKRKERYRRKIEKHILTTLGEQDVWTDEGADVDDILERTANRFDMSVNALRPLLEDLIDEDGSPLEEQDHAITTSTEKTFRDYFEEKYSLGEVQHMIGPYIKSTGEAITEDENERTFYCTHCKKHFGESELTPIQVEHRECKECGQKLDLWATPRPESRENSPPPEEIGKKMAEE